MIMITMKLIMMMTTSIDNSYFGNLMQDVMAIKNRGKVTCGTTTIPFRGGVGIVLHLIQVQRW